MKRLAILAVAVAVAALAAVPAQAAQAGADYLVVGRAVTGAADPAAALDKVRQSLEGLARSKA